MSVEEYTREFEKLLIKRDLHAVEEQIIVRYLGGLDPKYAHVVDLQAFTTFDEVCVLAHKVEQQMKNQPIKRDFLKPLPTSPPCHEENSFQPSKPVPHLTPYSQKKPSSIKRPSPSKSTKPHTYCPKNVFQVPRPWAHCLGVPKQNNHLLGRMGVQQGGKEGKGGPFDGSGGRMY